MAQIDAAADALVNYAETLRPLFDVAEALKGLGSLEQAISERKTALASAAAQHDDLKTQLNAANDELNAMREAKSEEMKAADERIQAMLAEATTQADSMTTSAQKLADELVANARDEVTRVQIVNDAAVTYARAELAKVNEQLAEAVATRDQAILDTADAAVQMEKMRETAQSFAAAPPKTQPIFATTPGQSAAQTQAQQSTGQ